MRIYAAVFNKHEPNILELRQQLSQVRRQRNAAGGDGRALELESRLAMLLAQQTSQPEEQREGLIRGERVWDVISDPQGGLPPTSAAAMSIALCQTMKRCALQLRDDEAAQMWMSRMRGSSAAYGRASSSSSYGEPPTLSPEAFLQDHASAATAVPSSTPGGASSVGDAAEGDIDPEADMKNSQSTTTATRVQELYADLLHDDDDDDLERFRQRKAEHAKMRHQKHPVPPRSGSNSSDCITDEEGLSPEERNKRAVLQMMMEMQKGDPWTGGVKTKKSGAPGSQQQQTAAQYRRGSSMHHMRQQMVVEDHPMVTAIFRKTPPVGPRWT